MKKKRIVGNEKPNKTLRLPDLDQAKSAVLNSLPSQESQQGYRHAIEEFIAWYCSEPRLSFNKTVVTRYRVHLESRQLAPGTINGRLGAEVPFWETSQRTRPRAPGSPRHPVVPLSSLIPLIRV